MHDSVTATFGGRSLTFKIDRQDLSLFESYSGTPAYEMFTRITAGQWTIENIKTVLKFATVTPAKLKELRQFTGVLSHALHPFGDYLNGYFRENAPLVNTTLARNAPAQYAALAQSILAAALFGISAADATFSDGTMDG